jgi:hypothetical protein
MVANKASVAIPFDPIVSYFLSFEKWRCERPPYQQIYPLTYHIRSLHDEKIMSTKESANPLIGLAFLIVKRNHEPLNISRF